MARRGIHARKYSWNAIRDLAAREWCRMWLVVERDTMTHEIQSVRPAHDGNASALNASSTGGDQ